MPWRAHGRLHATVIVKATFAFRFQRPMMVVDPLPLVAQDIHHDGQSARSVRVPGDDAPYLRHADVVLTGHAHAGAGQSAARARLVVHGQRTLLDKTVYVYGDREALPNGPSAAQPFSRMPLRYERAVGDRRGLNPVGRRPGDTNLLPNILDPHRPAYPAGFGALARSWPVRQQRVPPEALAGLAGPVMEIPDGFDWSYFRAAPVDQRTPYLHGFEWLVLDGLDPEQSRVQTRLPGAVAAAWVWVPSTQGYALEMHADSLFIDADAGRCTLCWRGAFPIASEEVLAAVRVLAGVQYRDQPIDWRREIAQVESAVPAPSRPVVEVDGGGTLSFCKAFDPFADTMDRAARKQATTPARESSATEAAPQPPAAQAPPAKRQDPFEQTVGYRAAKPVVAAPAAPGSAPMPAKDDFGGGTVDTRGARPEGPATPFQPDPGKAPPPLAAPLLPKRAPDPFQRTADSRGDQPPAAPLPFADWRANAGAPPDFSRSLDDRYAEPPAPPPLVAAPPAARALEPPPLPHGPRELPPPPALLGAAAPPSAPCEDGVGLGAAFLAAFGHGGE